MKKALAFICVLALALTLVSSFAFAAAPEETEKEPVMTRGFDAFFRVTKSTRLYSRADFGSAYACPSAIPVGTVLKVDLSYIPPNFFYARHTIGSNAYTGYVPQSDVARVN